MQRTFSAVLTKGEIAIVALCPELGVVSQGKTKKEALANLREAVELYLEDEDVPIRLKKHAVPKTELVQIRVTC